MVEPARGLAPAGIALRVTEAHKPPHHDKVAAHGEDSDSTEVYFVMTK